MQERVSGVGGVSRSNQVSNSRNGPGHEDLHPGVSRMAHHGHGLRHRCDVVVQEVSGLRAELQLCV